MKVSDLASRLGIAPDTVRFYSRIGYLTPVKNPENGYREFRQSDCQRLNFILSARKLGFSVEDIGQLLHEADDGKSPCPLARELIEQRLEEMEQRLADTARLLERMRSAVKEWSHQPDCKPTGQKVCHLIENFSVEV